MCLFGIFPKIQTVFYKSLVIPHFYEVLFLP